MFRREAEPAEAEHPTAGPLLERREKRPAAESAIFTEGRTFAERKAGAEAREAQRSQRRLASLGPTEFTQRSKRTGEVEYVPAELIMNVDKPMERFVQIAGMPGRHPLHAVSGKEDSVTPIPGAVRRIGRGPGQYATPAIQDPPPRPV